MCFVTPVFLNMVPCHRSQWILCHVNIVRMSNVVFVMDRHKWDLVVRALETILDDDRDFCCQRQNSINKSISSVCFAESAHVS